jgi:hypothetical protein
LRTFVYLTDIEITKGNAAKLVAAGRGRWEIENEGFNVQKNHRCFIEHACSEHYGAMKCHYLLAQIAEIIMQLYENGVKAIKSANRAYVNILNIMKSFLDGGQHCIFVYSSVLIFLAALLYNPGRPVIMYAGQT